MQRARTADCLIALPPMSSRLSSWVSPRGRIPRSTYWLLYVLPHVTAAVLALSIAPRSYAALVVWGLAFLLWLPGAAKRLHDHGGSAWILAAAFPGGVLLVMILGRLGEPRPFFDDMVRTPALVAWTTVSMGWVLLGFFLAFAKGKRGANKYGDDPLA
jgi:uncharacterized membrane protein YhaH (DUF805 family)